MDRQMRKALFSRGRYDWETHEITRQRNARQIADLPTPEFPATGTKRIGMLIAEARRQRDQALVSGSAGLRTETPADNTIPTTAPVVRHQQPAHIR